MLRILQSFTSLLLLLLLVTCSQPPADDATLETEAESEVTETPESNQDNTANYEAEEEEPYLLSNGYFLGMQPGLPIIDFAGGLRKGNLATGEGDFEVYYIDGAEGSELGYLMPDPRDEHSIGDIFITSPDVVTELGVRVGHSFAELQKRLGPLEVHGSEIEGRTYASKDGLWYRLDTANFSYEVDPATIDPTTKITEIVIQR
ncbi:MAG: hypothetical protein AAGA31_05310 [Bacteroidota bacterium]